MAKQLKQCKDAKDFTKYAQHKGATVCEGGNHTLVKTQKGTCAIPRHKGDLATGTRFSIIKTFLAIGLVIAIVMVVGMMGVF